MTRATAALYILLVLPAVERADLALADCDQPPQHIYTLYRDSMLPGFRIHVATFDAEHGEKYNRENCETARNLFVGQGVAVRYWCERGRFNPKSP